jgi:hypothetical protein
MLILRARRASGSTSEQAARADRGLPHRRPRAAALRSQLEREQPVEQYPERSSRNHKPAANWRGRKPKCNCRADAKLAANRSIAVKVRVKWAGSVLQPGAYNKEHDIQDHANRSWESWLNERLDVRMRLMLEAAGEELAESLDSERKQSRDELSHEVKRLWAASPNCRKHFAPFNKIQQKALEASCERMN